MWNIVGRLCVNVFWCLIVCYISSCVSRDIIDRVDKVKKVISK